MSNKYTVKKQGNDWVVVIKKTGIIIAYLDNKCQAEEYMQVQIMDDERSEYYAEYNREMLLKELMHEYMEIVKEVHCNN